MADGAEQFDGRHIIGPDTKILGGVLLTRAAIVVDFAENPFPYELAYRTTDGILTKDQQASALEVAGTVNAVVSRFMPFSAAAVCKILLNEAQNRGIEHVDQSHPIELSKFILEGGICQQQALLAGAIVELLQERRGIGGRVGLDSPLGQDDPDGHIAAVYELEGEVAFIDPVAWGFEGIMAAYNSEDF